MRTTDLALRTLNCILIVVFAGCIPGRALPQTEQEKDNAASQEKKPEEKKPETAPKAGSIEILSDTQGVDFGRYMKKLRYTVQSHWDPLVPAVAQPPISKSGTVVIEFAIMKDGKVDGMKLAKSSNDFKLDAAAWGAIINSIPLPTLPPEFKGDSLRMRCSFAYNPPPVKPPLEANPDTTR